MVKRNRFSTHAHAMDTYIGQVPELDMSEGTPALPNTGILVSKSFPAGVLIDRASYHVFKRRISHSELLTHHFTYLHKPLDKKYSVLDFKALQAYLDILESQN